ncbi:MAG: GNAT family protein [Rhodoferax sp.]|uniref:GNAT family N-acetyltransferase n=1 Tax=Rhodoferax sp. TaxID=50421 RepID=UPI002ACDCF71|nr:GNAT family protein [Rhodoferax sp.]MDZ7893468.1 GNAT family protein [Rhodoferax sp.]
MTLENLTKSELKPLLYENQGKTLTVSGMYHPRNYDKRSPVAENSGAVRAAKETGIAVSIRALGPNHRERLRKHLLALETADRFLRFGYVATDQQISAYVDRLDFINDAVFGVFNRRLHIVAMAHLAICNSPNGPPVGDFGVSVAPSLRGHGIGGRLYERAALHACNEGVEVLQIQALAENGAMLAIARKRGATVHRQGSESEAYLKLPHPDLESRLRELAGEYLAGLHYSLVAQSRIWVEMLKGFQSVRSRAIAAAKICSP